MNVRTGNRDQFKKLIVVYSSIFEIFHCVTGYCPWQLNSPYILPVANTAQPPSLDIYGDGCGSGKVPELWRCHRRGCL